MKENSTLNVLYGGVGDGRHVYATILEDHNQNEKNNAGVRLHVTMNDISATLLTKDILVLVLMYQIGSLLNKNTKPQNILKDLKDSKEAYLIMTVLYYKYINLRYAS